MTMDEMTTLLAVRARFAGWSQNEVDVYREMARITEDPRKFLARWAKQIKQYQGANAP